MPDPTYQAQPEGEQTKFTCLVPDAGQTSGVCGFWVWEEDQIVQHLNQRHAGILVKAPAVAGDEVAPAADSLIPPAAPGSASPDADPDDIPDPVPPASEG